MHNVHSLCSGICGLFLCEDRHISGGTCRAFVVSSGVVPTSSFVVPSVRSLSEVVLAASVIVFVLVFVVFAWADADLRTVVVSSFGIATTDACIFEEPVLGYA